MRAPTILLRELVPDRIEVLASPEWWDQCKLLGVLVPWAADRLNQIRRLRYLFDSDCIVLVYEMVCLQAQGRLWPLNATIREEDMDRCLSFSSRVMLDALFPERENVFDIVGMTDAVVEWLPGLLSARARGRTAHASPRDQVIHRIMTEMRTHFGPRRDTKQFDSLVIAKACETRVFDRRSECTPEMVGAILNHYRSITGGSPGGIYRAADGSIRMAEHPLRDFMCSHLAGKRIRKPVRSVADDGEKKRAKPAFVELEEDATADLDALGIPEVVGAVDAVRRVREELALRLQRCRSGSLAERVLPYVIPFLGRQMSAAEVARRLGASTSAAHTALHGHAEGLKRTFASKNS